MNENKDLYEAYEILLKSNSISSLSEVAGAAATTPADKKPQTTTKEVLMNTNITTATDTAMPGDYYKALSDRAALATSLEATVSYLESCLEKHGEAGMAAAYFNRASRNCQRLADELRKLKDDNAALVRYRNNLFELDEAQLEAFARIKIDYQARISGDFQPVTTNHYLAELHAIAFAVAAINRPVCMGGVGVGFGPRAKLSEAA